MRSTSATSSSSSSSSSSSGGGRIASRKVRRGNRSSSRGGGGGSGGATPSPSTSSTSSGDGSLVASRKRRRGSRSSSRGGGGGATSLPRTKRSSGSSSSSSSSRKQKRCSTGANVALEVLNKTRLQLRRKVRGDCASYKLEGPPRSDKELKRRVRARATRVANIRRLRAKVLRLQKSYDAIVSRLSVAARTQHLASIPHHEAPCEFSSPAPS